MKERLERLVSLGSEMLVREGARLDDAVEESARFAELAELLRRKNGFYAFESALHVFPSHSTDAVTGLDVWNAPDCWRDAYDDLCEGCFFFAEDVFGGQFCIRDDRICSFDPETGDVEPMADGLEGWAARVLEDYPVLTGYPLAHQWQVAHGPLEMGKRLVPKLPFVGGGDFTLENLYVLDAREAMRQRGELAVQIRDLPDGATIRFEVVD